MSSKDIQQYLICPITLKLFNDPVLAEDGNTYEREAITQWIVQHGTSPKTKKVLKLNQLTLNNQIKNAVEAFKQTSRIDYGENRQSLENLDVLCLYCGFPQKLKNMKDHKIRCSSNPDNIQKFQMMDNEDVFTITPTNKSSTNRKIFSFQNPLASRINTENSLQTPTEQNTNIELAKTNPRCSLSIKYFFIILLIIILTGIIITLAIFYIQCKEQHITTEATSTSTSSPRFLCLSAEWDSNAITVVSDLYIPYDIAIDSENNLIVADSENRRLQKYFSNGTNITLLTNTKVLSVFIDKFDNIYLTDSFGNEVQKLNLKDNIKTTVAGFGRSGSDLDQLKLEGQSGIYVDQNGTLYISDTGNHRVVKYFLNSTSGIIVAGGHGQGSNSNQLNTPYGIYIDEINEIGAIYICDKQNHRIQKWINGANQGITVALDNNQLYSPVSILLESTSNQMIMYISSLSRNLILKWIPNAEQPENIVVGISDNTGSKSNQLFSQRGIKFDKYWNLFVADTGNNRIQKFLFNISSCEKQF